MINHGLTLMIWMILEIEFYDFPGFVMRSELSPVVFGLDVILLK